jgi:hypothetical protein
MKSRYEQSLRFNAVGLATGSILALIVAMFISFVFDVVPSDAAVATTDASAIVSAGR